MTRRIKDVFLDYKDLNGKRWERTPRQMISALKDAGDVMSYSNYHNGLFEKIEEIIRRYCEEHKIPLGMSDKQYRYQQERKHKATMKILNSGDIKAMTKLLQKGFF